MSASYDIEKQAKELYLQTDLTDVAAVQAAISSLSTNKQLSNKGKYLEALHSANPANLSKAKKYHELTNSAIKKNFGWILMGLFAVLMGVIDPDFEDSLTSWISLGFCVGAGIQIYIATLKSAWSKLTLCGLVLHPAVVTSSSSTTSTTTASSNITSESRLCDQCGAKIASDTQFCSECGNKLN